MVVLQKCCTLILGDIKPEFLDFKKYGGKVPFVAVTPKSTLSDITDQGLNNGSNSSLLFQKNEVLKPEARTSMV